MTRRKSWNAETARALRYQGERPAEIARILKVHPSQVSRWLRGESVNSIVSIPLRAPKGKVSIPPVESVKPLSHPSTKPLRGFIGAHRWVWTAKIAEVGRDLILPERYALRHTWVWSGQWEVGGHKVRLQLHRGQRGGSAPGSLIVRYSLDALPAETPYELRDRAARLVQEVLSSVARERRMHFASVRLSGKPHYEGGGEALAGLAGKDFRVTTQDAYGQVWIDWSRPMTREASTAESLAAYLRLDGNLQATLEEVRAVREELRVVPEVVGALRELSGEIRGVSDRPQKSPPPPGPGGIYG